MSRWLWALLGGVVLVAIAAFWTVSNQTNVAPSVSLSPAPVTPAPAPRRLLLRRSPRNRRPRRLPPLLRRKPRLRLHPRLRRRPRRRPQPRPLRLRPPRPLPLPRRPPSRPLLRPSSRSAPASASSRRSARRGAPDAARARTGGGSPGRIRAQEPGAAGRDMGLFGGGLRAAFRAARRRLGLSAAGGQVRPGRDRRVAEEDPSAFRHLPDRGRVSNGRRTQGER